ncbi:MAG: L,D-transpeptidase family protein [Actinomycetota bacterium]
MKRIICAAIIIFLLIFAGCSHAAVQEEDIQAEGQKQAKEETAEEELPKDPVELEEPEPEDENEQIPDAGQEPAGESPQKEDPPDAGQKNKPQDMQPPSVNLEVIEGPSYDQGGSICYYRVKASADGNPDPQLVWSKDDSKGAWGSDIAQVNLSKDQSYELEVRAENEAGTSTDSITLEWAGQEDGGDKQIDYGDSDKFRIDVSLDEQTVRVYYEEDFLREMPCSGGTPEDPTPVGTFKTSQKIYYSWLPRFDVGAYYFVRFYGSYLFHSLPFDEDGNLIQEEAKKLGQPASHGCIRLKVEDARWLYETLPLGVEVNIY